MGALSGFSPLSPGLVRTGASQVCAGQMHCASASGAEPEWGKDPGITPLGWSGAGACGLLGHGDLMPSFPEITCHYLAFGSLKVTLLGLVFCLLLKTVCLLEKIRKAEKFNLRKKSHGAMPTIRVWRSSSSSPVFCVFLKKCDHACGHQPAWSPEGTQEHKSLFRASTGAVYMVSSRAAPCCPRGGDVPWFPP